MKLISDTVALKSETLKLKYLQSRIESIKKDIEALPKTAEELSRLNKIMFNWSEATIELKDAVKRFFTINKDMWMERVATHLENRRNALHEYVDSLNEEAKLLARSIHEKTEAIKVAEVNRVDLASREPIPETN